MTEVPIGWLCPNCNYDAFARLEDGRKQCGKCKEIFGVKEKEPYEKKSKEINWSKHRMNTKTSRGNTMRLRHYGSGKFGF